MTGTFTSRARALIGCTATLGVAAVGLTALPAAAAPSPTPFISEIHYDNVGADAGERVEVQVALGTDLTGYRLVPYNGNGGAAYSPAATLSGVVTSPAGDPSGDGVVVVDVPGLQNGAPDGVALVTPSGALVEFLSYEGTFVGVGGAANGVTSTDIGVAQVGTEPLGSSLQKVAGAWTATTANSFGAVNGGGAPDPDPEPEPDLCTATVTSAVGAVQGSGPVSPVVGTQVTLRGVVTSDTPGLSGFTVQDAGDGDPATSDGIFVLAPGVDVARGDVVTVRGPVFESFTLTQVGTAAAAATVDVCSSGASAPAPTVLTLPADAATRESLESMRVDITTPLVVTGTFGLDRFGEVRLATGVLPTPTDVAEPGAAAAAVEADNRLREITVDDGRSASDVRPVPYLTLDDSVRIGDPVTGLGDHVLSYGFNQWRLQPVTGAPDQVTFGTSNPRSPTADPVGGDVQVGAYNVLNYFVTLLSENPNARGAATQADLDLQQAKIVNGIIGLGADVVALQEIEYGARFGKSPDVAVATLTAAVDAADTTGTWDYVRTPTYVRPSPDVIQNAIIYRSDVVTPVGASLTGGSFDPQAWSNAREPVAQTFAAADGDEFTVVGNHFKSKSPGASSIPGNADSGDGQGAFNADRVRQAQALVAFADTLEAVDADVFLIGDFNAYSREDPIDVLRAAGYVDVLEPLEDTTYSFDQRNGNLDHVLVSAHAADKLTGSDIWEVNAAEPDAYQYDSGIPALLSTYAYRASDHNPSVVGFDTLATDVSLADVLATVSGPFDRTATDFDVLGALVADVLAAKPDSPVGVLADPTVELTAFLPDDAAFSATVPTLFPGRVPQERVAYNRLRNGFTVDQLEAILLGHVVLGRTLESADVVALDGQQLTTAAGTTLTVDVRADGSIAIQDQRVGNRDALLVLTGLDINIGQVQVAHTVDRVLLP